MNRKNRRVKNTSHIVITLATIVVIGIYLLLEAYFTTKSLYLLIGCFSFIICATMYYYYEQRIILNIQVSIGICMLIACASPPKIEVGPLKDGIIGIDISKWNGNVPLQTMITEIDFVIIRCGYTSNIDGTTHKTDEYFEQNIKQCIDLGIPYGVYYYSLASNPELAQAEAQYVLTLLDGRVPPLGVFFDFEDENFQGHLTKEKGTSIALAFVETITLAQMNAGVYANYNWWNHKLDANALQGYTKWIAFYNDAYYMEDMYHIHQYTDEGNVSGISGYFDLNVVFEKFW